VSRRRHSGVGTPGGQVWSCAASSHFLRDLGHFPFRERNGRGTPRFTAAIYEVECAVLRLLLRGGVALKLHSSCLRATQGTPERAAFSRASGANWPGVPRQVTPRSVVCRRHTDLRSFCTVHRVQLATGAGSSGDCGHAISAFSSAWAGSNGSVSRPTPVHSWSATSNKSRRIHEPMVAIARVDLLVASTTPRHLAGSRGSRRCRRKRMSSRAVHEVTHNVGLVVRLATMLFRRDLLVVDVHGRSMWPALAPGDRLFCSRRTRPWIGAIVIRAQPDRETSSAYQIKRLVGLPGHESGGHVIATGFCWIEGDNAATSADSRNYGPVPLSEVKAVAVARLAREGLIDLSR
jgi:signal peptidase I